MVSIHNIKGKKMKEERVGGGKKERECAIIVIDDILKLRFVFLSFM